MKYSIMKRARLSVVPAESLLIFCLLLRDTQCTKWICPRKMAIGFMLLLINLFFGIMKQQTKYQEKQNRENEYLRMQNAYFAAGKAAVEDKGRQLGKICHDLKNAYILEMGYLENGQLDLLKKHYQQVLKYLPHGKSLIQSHNICIDSIIHYKLETARRQKINLTHTLQFAGTPPVNNEDLLSLLGNLFDNAFEAVLKLPEDVREVFFKLSTDSTGLLFHIANPYEGEIRRDKSGIRLTNKKDGGWCSHSPHGHSPHGHSPHGLGLSIVSDIVRKYDGRVEIEDHDGQFLVTVFICTQ